MDTFIKKLNKLNLFLVENNGDLVLKGRKGTLTKEEIKVIKEDDQIINFIKNNKKQLVDYLRKKSSEKRSIYPLSPLQEGMLFHHLYDKASKSYLQQFEMEFLEGLDLAAFKGAWENILATHTILRSSIIDDKLSIPVQCVYPIVQLPFCETDICDLNPQQQVEAIAAFKQSDLSKGFDFETPPLMRINLLKLGENKYKMIWTFHLILLDGWSMPIVLQELLANYEVLSKGEPLENKPEDKYEDYINYINGKDAYASQKFWKEYLKGFETST